MREATFTNALMNAMLRAMPIRRTLSSAELRRAAKGIAPFVHAFDLMQEHVVITDGHAHILYANSAAERATGFSLRQMLGKNPADRGHARIRSIRSIVREFLFLFTESVARAARPKRFGIRCVLTKRGKHASMVFSAPSTALRRRKDASNLSIPRIIARYLRWEGPVERKKGNMHQWIIRVLPHHPA